jgi:adenylylsulfate kinase-like enzyme
MIYVLYGQPGSGKTSLGRLLVATLMTPFHIDGDEFRSFFTNRDYGFGGRKKNIRAANAVATYLSKTRTEAVVMTLVNPYNQFRRELEEDNEGHFVDILLTTKRELRKEYHVEDFECGDPRLVLNTDSDINTTWELLRSKIATLRS